MRLRTDTIDQKQPAARTQTTHVMIIIIYHVITLILSERAHILHLFWQPHSHKRCPSYYYNLSSVQADLSAIVSALFLMKNSRY